MDVSQGRHWPAFRVEAEPEASIVVPVHGKWDITEQCLRSLEVMVTGRSYEVIVVDDCSPDDTAANLSHVSGVVAVSTPTNVGFVDACNLGASRARGNVLVLLNNDTIVHPGWLDALLELLDRDPSIGLVGSLLLGADGLVQESGGILWSNANAWNYGRGLSPDCAKVRAVRDVDYCSGAAIAIRMELFTELGGLDTRYSPAYYEDTDLCFAVRAAGYRVVVQPDAVVTHLEGVSHGTDTTGGLKRFQPVNREVFRRKWGRQLADRASGPSLAALWYGRNRRPAGMVLVVDSHVPTPDRDSGSRRMSGILSELLDMGYSVHFAPAEHIALQPYGHALEERGITVLTTADEQREFLREAGPELAAAIICRPTVIWNYLDDLYTCAPDALIVYDTVDLHSLRIRRQAEAERDDGLARIAELIWARESAAMRASDVTVVVSEFERDLLATMVPDVDVRVLSNIHQPVVTRPEIAGRSTVLFVGGYQHQPNVDAAVWAATEIMPTVRLAVPDATLVLVGSHMPQLVSDLAGAGVDAVGWVPELGPLYRRARVVIAPLRYGAGVKGKVAEAIEFGVPLVGTPIALEGMHLIEGVDVLSDADADGFAACIVRVLTDDVLWRSMAGRGQRRLVEQFSPKVARSVLTDVLSTVAVRRKVTGGGGGSAARDTADVAGTSAVQSLRPPHGSG